MSDVNRTGNDASSLNLSPGDEPADETRLDPAEVDAIEEITTAEAIGSDGTKMRRAITMRDFLPPGEKDQVLAELMTQPVGFFLLLGALIGKVRRAEARTNEYQGKTLESIVCIGSFEATNLRDGVVSQGSAAFLPMSLAEPIMMSLQENPGSVVSINVDIGLEKTGRTIFYEWAVRSYRESEIAKDLRDEKAALTARLARRKRIGGRPSAPPTIEGKVTASK